ncbi:MAG: lipopolysaccharide biosynthesis protein [Spirosomataceae bacterium]
MSTALSNLPYANLIKKVGITGIAQVVIQLVSVISGILIIRYLSVEQYALYTIANSMLGTMTVFSDSGISTGLMAMGGKVYTDKVKLGGILAIGLELRKKYAIYAVLLILPLTVYLVWQNSHSLIWSFAVPLAILPAFWVVLSMSLYEVILKLHQEVVELQKIQVGVSLLRLGIVSVLVYFIPWAALVLVVHGIPQWIANRKMEKKVTAYANQEIVIEDKIQKETRKEYRKLTLRILPGVIYYAISGQIVVWVLSLSGEQVVTVGQLGAIGRLGALFSLVGTLAAVLVYPRFATLPSSKVELSSFLLKSTSFLLFLHGLVIGMSYVTSSWLLAILGPEYLHLDKELVLFMISSSVGLLAGHAYGFGSARGWIMPPTLNIGFNAFAILLGLLLFKLDNIENAIFYTLFMGAAQFVLNGGYLIKKTISV